MDLETLNWHIVLLQRLKQAEALLSNLRAQAEPGAQVLTETPHASGYRDRVRDLDAEIADVECVVDDLTADIERSAKVIEVFVSSISDTRTRAIFKLHFLRGLPWREVADTVDGSKDAIRQNAYRYLCNQATNKKIQ